MGICPTELRDYVIRPALKQLGDWSSAGENLLLGTAAQESGLGFHIKQNKHRAFGIYHIDPLTHQAVWNNFLAKDPDLASKVRGLASQHEFLKHPNFELATNLSYASAIAWAIYKRKGKPLPEADDIEGLGRFWKRYYHGKTDGSVADFVYSYHEYILKNISQMELAL